jgi:NADH dehydrogenase
LSRIRGQAVPGTRIGVIAALARLARGSIIFDMILVTGATGFIGRALIRQLSEAGYSLRALLRPSRRSPRLPVGVPVEAAVVSLADERGLRAALSGVDVIFHLASAESQGRDANLFATDIQGTLNLTQAAVDAGARRIIYVSHVGASRASGYPAFKAKGIAEEHIRRSGLEYTILRSTVVFGPEDHFTNGLAWMLRAAPGVFPLPGDGRPALQPLWVEDLVTCMIWSMNNPETVNQTFEVGGSEYFSLRQTLEILMPLVRAPRYLLPVSPATLRMWTVFFETFVPNFPASSFWLDYVAVSRTCPADATPRAFGLMPARFTYRLNYLARRPWYAGLQAGFQRMSGAVGERVQQVLETIRSR